MITASSTSVLKKLLILFLLIAGVILAKEFLIPLAIGGVLATVFLPLCKRFETKLPRALAAICCILILLLMIAGIVMLVGWQVGELSKDFDIIKQKSMAMASSTQDYIFHNLGVSKEKQMEALKDQKPAVGSQIKQLAAALPTLLTNSLLVLAYLFLLLYYRSHIKRFIQKLTDSSESRETEKVINSVAHVSEQYLLGLGKMIICLWVMYGVGFSALGLKHALFFAFLCGLLEIIPFVGNITGTGLTLLVAAVQGSEAPVLIGIGVVYVLAQIIQGSVIQPLIVGSEVKINPLFVIISLVVGGAMWGLSGVFLAIPLTAMLKVVCDHIQPLKPYGFLMGEVGPATEPPTFIINLKKWWKGRRSKKR